MDNEQAKHEREFISKPPGMLGAICEWINLTSIRYQPMITLATVLPFLGALFGRKVKWGNLRTNVYCLNIAGASFGKAHATNKIKKLANAAECNYLIGGYDIASDAALEKELARQPSLVCFWDEVGHMIKGMKSEYAPYTAKIIPLLMQLYSSSDSIVIGKARAGKETKILEEPCFSFCGSSSTERFLQSISLDEVRDGWLGRCIVFSTQKMVPKNRALFSDSVYNLPPNWIVEYIKGWHNPDEMPAMNIELTGNQTIFRPNPTQIAIAPNAEIAFENLDSVADYHYKKRHVYFEIWSRAEENAKKIAMILACCDCSRDDVPVVTQEIAEYSCRLTKYCVKKFISLLKGKTNNPAFNEERNRILSIIQGYGIHGCSWQTFAKKTQSIRRHIRKEILQSLQEGGYIRIEPNVIPNKTRLYYIYDRHKQRESNSDTSCSK